MAKGAVPWRTSHSRTTSALSALRVQLSSIEGIFSCFKPASCTEAHSRDPFPIYYWNRPQAAAGLCSTGSAAGGVGSSGGNSAGVGAVSVFERAGPSSAETTGAPICGAVGAISKLR
jgi:hypothetical protein